MTLQECYDKNDREGFLVIAWKLSCCRRITHHEYCELKEIYDKWDFFKSSKPNAKVFLGNLGFKDGKYIFAQIGG